MVHLSHAYMITVKIIVCHKNKLEHVRLGWHPESTCDTHQLLSHVDASDSGRVVTGSVMGNLPLWWRLLVSPWSRSNRQSQHHLVFCVWLSTERMSSQGLMECYVGVEFLASSPQTLCFDPLFQFYSFQLLFSIISSPFQVYKFSH